jgi:hypothetical protein
MLVEFSIVPVGSEVKLLGEDAEKARLDLEETVDCLKPEMESLKMTLKELVPNFQYKFKCTRDIVLREIDPLRLDKK